MDVPHCLLSYYHHPDAIFDQPRIQYADFDFEGASLSSSETSRPSPSILCLGCPWDVYKTFRVLSKSATGHDAITA